MRRAGAEALQHAGHFRLPSLPRHVQNKSGGRVRPPLEKVPKVAEDSDRYSFICI
jgi:hypothetical protein